MEASAVNKLWVKGIARQSLAMPILLQRPGNRLTIKADVSNTVCFKILDMDFDREAGCP